MRTFYLASSMNAPDAPRAGGSLPVAQQIARALEGVTGDRCIARWLYHKQQNQEPFLDLMAAVNMADIAQADFVVVVPLTRTSRGTHVEMGMALAMGKPTYIYRPPHLDSLAFDGLCLKMPSDWAAIVAEVVSAGRRDSGRGEREAPEAVAAPHPPAAKLEDMTLEDLVAAANHNMPSAYLDEVLRRIRRGAP